MEHLAEYVFNEDYVSIITAEYSHYLRGQSEELHYELRSAKQRLAIIENDLSKLADLLIQTQAPTLLEKLDSLEREKAELQSKQQMAQQDREKIQVSEDEIRKLFLGAKGIPENFV